MQTIPSTRAVAFKGAKYVTPNRRGAALVATSTATSEVSTASKKEIKLSGPEPQRFVVAEGELTNVASAAFCAVARLGSGVFALGYKNSIVKDTPDNANEYSVTSLPLGFRTKETSKVALYPRPTEPITIYDSQCFNSRKIREAVCILDIDAIFKPCPEGFTGWDEELSKFGITNTVTAAQQIPFLVDPNHGIEMSDADEIVAFLFRNYGNNKIPLVLKKGLFNDVTAKIGTAPRKGMGEKYTGAPEKRPEMPLELWGYEGSPFSVIVREVLCELGISYLFKPTARGSPKRQQLFERRQLFQVPYLEDPNTGVAMFESKAIVEYLRKTYGA